jgi:hypothetical protein
MCSFCACSVDTFPRCRQCQREGREVGTSYQGPVPDCVACVFVCLSRSVCRLHITLTVQAQVTLQLTVNLFHVVKRISAGVALLEGGLRSVSFHWALNLFSAALRAETWLSWQLWPHHHVATMDHCLQLSWVTPQVTAHEMCHSDTKTAVVV